MEVCVVLPRRLFKPFIILDPLKGKERVEGPDMVSIRQTEDDSRVVVIPFVFPVDRTPMSDSISLETRFIR